MRSRLQENPRPNRPRLQTAWDKGEHDDLDPTAPTEGIEPQQRGSNFIGRRAFDTMKGLGLLFHPGPLDKGIGRKVTWEQETRNGTRRGSTWTRTKPSHTRLTGGD